MSIVTPESIETAVPSEADAHSALESSRAPAARNLGRRASVCLRIGDGDGTARAKVLGWLTAEAQELRLATDRLSGPQTGPVEGGLCRRIGGATTGGPGCSATGRDRFLAHSTVW